MLKEHKIDALLITETHCTSNSYIKFDGFNTYLTNHPDGKAHGGTCIVIKNNIKHHALPDFRTNHIQASVVAVKDKCGYFTIASVYCPPKHNINKDMFKELFMQLGDRFIAGGDWNAKHTYWGSRLTTTRGRQLNLALVSNQLVPVSTAEPTYWPTDRNKIPDLLDFFIVKGLSQHYFKAESCYDSSSDHTPVLLTVSTTIIHNQKPETLYNKYSDWYSFREFMECNIKLDIALKTPEEIENATHYITTLIQEACWRSTPSQSDEVVTANVPLQVKLQILEKRRLRRIWHTSRHQTDKAAFNRACKELKMKLQEIQESTIEHKLASATPTVASNYSLWKLTNSTGRPIQAKPPLKLDNGTWARSCQEKVNAFAENLASVFVPNEAGNSSDFEDSCDLIINAAYQLDVPPKPISPREIATLIRGLDSKKAPGFDLITKEVLKELPTKALVFLSYLFNGILRTQYFPSLWKVSQILMIHKAGKPPHDLNSYRPISLLPTLSKLFERALLHRLTPILIKNNIVPSHQFGFRQEHSTVEQVHRVCDKIRKTLEQKQYCASAFLDIQQAFDKVWHKGLHCKLKSVLPHSYIPLLVSYLSERIFQIKDGDTTSKFYNVSAGVPQGSVLGPTLYTLFTADLPSIPNITTATFADDTAILASHKNAASASLLLQQGLDQIATWLQNWRIKASASKSVQVTFALRQGNCPQVNLGSDPLPHRDHVKYLGLYLDRRLTWKKHIKTKREELNIRFKTFHWLLGRNSRLSVDNKLLIYTTILKPTWAYGAQLWGSACDSSLNILQRMQNIILRSIANTPWFVTNEELHKHLQVPSIKEEVRGLSIHYKKRLLTHPNPLAHRLLVEEYPRRLKRKQILDLDI